MHRFNITGHHAIIRLDIIIVTISAHDVLDNIICDVYILLTHYMIEGEIKFISSSVLFKFDWIPLPFLLKLIPLVHVVVYVAPIDSYLRIYLQALECDGSLGHSYHYGGVIFYDNICSNYSQIGPFYNSCLI